MSIEVRDRVMIITGASSGIGAATALACARAGMRLLLNGRDSARLDQVAAKARGAGVRVETVVGDVAGAGAALLDAATAHFGGFYAVFANAGYGLSKPMHETTDDELRRIFEVNFFAANALICEAARRLIAANQPGHLLHCSSALAKFPLVKLSAYSATKAAQNHVCRAMRVELKPYGIHVSSVHPVATGTEFFARVRRYGGEHVTTDDANRAIPKWRLQTPEMVADAVVRGLRRPRAEIWTSAMTRTVAGIMTVFPSMLDAFMSRARS